MTKAKKPDVLQRLKVTREEMQNSADWFQQEIEALTQSARSTRQEILRLQNRASRFPVAGRMYLFVYDAKHKDTLPKWDIFPLVFFISAGNGHKIGINLHYMNPDLRIKFIQSMLGFANNKTLSATTRIVAQWNMIKAMSKTKGFGVEDCVKMYLNSHVRSMYIEIPPTSWLKVAYLQLEKFVYNK